MSKKTVEADEGIKLYAEVGLSENTFYRHAREGKIRKSLPDERERGALYDEEDILRIVEARRAKNRKRLEAIQTIKEEESKTDWFNESDLPYLLVLDYETYGIENSLDISISHEWWSKNPQICRVLFDTKNRKEIWGYITMIPMEEETIFKLLKREMNERDIRSQHILAYENGKEYTIYAASVVIKPEHRNHLRNLLKSIFNYWCEQYPTTKVSKIYAYADSEEGWKLIRHLFFAPRYDLGERVFELDLRQINPSKLITSYQNCVKEQIGQQKK